MRRFSLLRIEDETGVSGTGVVAQGVEFDDGVVALRWLTEWPTSVVFHDRGAAAVEHIHGHGGKTQVIWHDEERSPGVSSVAETPPQEDVERCGAGHWCCNEPAGPPVHDHFLDSADCPACGYADPPAADPAGGGRDVIGFVCGPAVGEDGAMRCQCCGFESDNLDAFAVGSCWPCVYGNPQCARCVEVGCWVDRFSSRRGKGHRLVAPLSEGEDVNTVCGFVIPAEDIGMAQAVKRECRRCWPEAADPAGGAGETP